MKRVPTGARAILIVTIPLTLLTFAWTPAYAAVASRSRAAGVRSADVIGEPSSGALLGAYVQPGGNGSQDDVEAAVGGLETSIGRTLGIDHHFYSWTKVFPTWQESWDNDNGRLPMDSWAGESSSAINSGSQDALIRARADALQALGFPVLVRWFGEMDGDYWKTTVGSASAFISAWKHIHDIFVQEGATNVGWVWCPNAYGFSTGVAQTFYPGDSYVDWICADGYNWSPLKPDGTSGGTWTDFSDIFSAFYAWAAPKGKPLLVGETGVQEDPNISGRKSQWITDMSTSLQQDYPAIEGLVYFDAIGDSNQGGTFDWTLTSSASAMNAFTDLAQDPYFGTPDTEPPSIPTNLTGLAPSPTEVKLSWTPSKDNVAVTSYTIYRDNASIGTSTVPSYTDDGLTPGTDYNYRVRAYDGAGNRSARSPHETVTTPQKRDTTPPAAPDVVTAVSSDPHSVSVTWDRSAAKDVMAYDIYRNGVYVSSTAPHQLGYSDDSVDPATSYEYQVVAADEAGNESPPSTDAAVTTAPEVLFDPFETGDLSNWTTVSGLVVQSSYVLDGTYAARATSTGSKGASATKNIVPMTDVYDKIPFEVISHGSTSAYLGRLRTSTGSSILGVYLRGDDSLAVYDDVTGASYVSATTVGDGVWHVLEFHAHVNGSAGQVEVWLDGVQLMDLSKTLSLGSTAVGQVQLGDGLTGRQFDLAFDDVEVNASFIPS